MSLQQNEDKIGDNYGVLRTETERERLDNLHAYMTDLLEGRLIIDDNIKLEAGARVLDSGTGAASWIRALQKEVPDSVELVGNDVYSGLFPKELPANVKLYELSSTNLPAEWEKSFDFVNHRLLAIALTMPQWRQVVSELFRVLRPGGSIQFMEFGHFGSVDDSVSFPAHRAAMDMAFAVMDKLDLLGIDSGRRLSQLVEEAGFSDVQIKIWKGPVGRQWGEMGIRGCKNSEAFLRAFGARLLAEGGLGLCSSQAEVDGRVDRAKKEWDERYGLYVPLYVITAKKL